jgi:hypothetical protein
MIFTQILTTIVLVLFYLKSKALEKQVELLQKRQKRTDRELDNVAEEFHYYDARLGDVEDYLDKEWLEFDVDSIFDDLLKEEGDENI